MSERYTNTSARAQSDSGDSLTSAAHDVATHANEGTGWGPSPNVPVGQSISGVDSCRTPDRRYSSELR